MTAVTRCTSLNSLNRKMINFSDCYRQNISTKDGNVQLFIGLKKHLLIAQTSSIEGRLICLNNIAEVLEFIAHNINDAIPEEERSILERFFKLLLVKTKNASISIHAKESFVNEIAFIDILLKSIAGSKETDHAEYQ